MTAVAGGLSWLAARLVPAVKIEFPARAELAATLGLLGVIFSVLGVVSFRRARTTVNPLTPDATTALVASGVYRVTRNPMYLGFLLFLLAEIVWLANPLALLVGPAFVLYLNRFQIVPEENALQARFGAEFQTYATRVRRMAYDIAAAVFLGWQLLRLKSAPPRGTAPSAASSRGV